MKKQLRRKTSKSLIVSCFIAGMTEMYDFVIFGLLASLIHKKYLGFVTGDSSLFITYALFSVGFICRPIGAIIFGYMGDIYGRKTAVVTSITTMGMASLGMFLMPSYESVGIASCYMIAVARIMQGLSVGGEMTGGVVYAIEHFDKNRSGFAGSFVIGGCLSGILLATLIANIVKMDSMPDYAWRFAFLFGFIMSLVGFFIRQRLTETPEFENMEKRTTKFPLLTGLKKNKLEALTTILIGASTGTNIYFAIVFIPSYLKKVTGLELSYVSSITMFVMAVLSPFFGWVSDFMSRGKLIMVGAALSSAYALIMLPMIVANPTVLTICVVIAVHSAIYSIQDGTVCVFSAEIFPPKYRYSCAAFCQSIGIGVIGGASPMIATLITENFADPNFILGLYVFTVTLLAGIGVALVMLKKQKFKVEDKFIYFNDYVTIN
jgi:MHS family proline/betaine transporter-like MFS transporter